MKLRYDPYQVFRSSKTPAGLYARQKWLDEAENRQWKNDFQETVSAHLADQLPDGSWAHESVRTIQHLFGLHLTVRSTTEQIEAALTWLLAKISIQNETIHVGSEDIATEDDLKGLPFIPSRPDMLLTGASLFLASIFGREDDPTVLSVYRWLCKQGVKNNGSWSDRASSHNIFRAMVVHPVFAKDRATELAVKMLATSTDKSDAWGNELTFYQTLNALAHLNFPQTEAQLAKAFERLFETQNMDGSWSRSEPEWNTFLAVHALKNKGFL
ncbi:hypothetical protein D1AOALGA4SA_9047 [Olavius algarvensis Delta 1 endosymbiont]|nr:hypothetical protein D1AOALGA4SA_9047 [Olavius algarvensis Delta 1 endosymbiont]